MRNSHQIMHKCISIQKKMILLQTKQNADLKKSEVKITQESSKSKISHAIELLSLYVSAN